MLVSGKSFSRNRFFFPGSLTGFIFCDTIPDVNITFRVHISALQVFIVVKRVNESKCTRPSCVTSFFKSRPVNDYEHSIHVLWIKT